MPSGDKFLDKFLTLYKSDDSGEFKNSLIMSLALFVSKASGCCNPEYGSKVVNFMLALSTTNAKAFSFVSANLVSMSIRHAGRLKAKQRSAPLVLRTHDDIKKLLLSQFGVIRDRSNDLSMRIAFSLGVDATVNVPG